MAIWELNHGNISSWEGDENLRTLILSSVEASGGDEGVEADGSHPEECCSLLMNEGVGISYPKGASRSHHICFVTAHSRWATTASWADASHL